MATKAETFRHDAERTGKPKTKKPGKRVPAHLRPESAERPGVLSTSDRNRSGTASRKAAYKLEDTGYGRPSRKSTRKAKNHQKPGSNLKRRQTRATTSPSARAARGSRG